MVTIILKFLATLVTLHFSPVSAVSQSLGRRFGLAYLRGLQACFRKFAHFGGEKMEPRILLVKKMVC